MNDVDAPIPPQEPQVQLVARVILAWFVFTFLAARGLVLAIMLRWVPTFYLQVGGTHIHHLNYGIFLLSLVGGYLLLRRPGGRALMVAAGAYGVGLALTFDEFGMWVHLGGPYWQRASFDAVVSIIAILALIDIAPRLRRFRPRHWLVSAALLLAMGLFGYLLVISVHHFAAEHISPMLHQVESRGP